jgi:hypothetical protein
MGTPSSSKLNVFFTVLVPGDPVTLTGDLLGEVLPSNWLRP